MDSLDFKAYYGYQLDRFEAYLKNSFPKLPKQVSILEESAKYSLFAGGKRIRPILLLTVIECAGHDSAFGLPFACALEYIHTYSLIHDDLPCMDDDALRRGQPTNHIKFGEAIALLAGDALLTHSFHLISSICSSDVSAVTINRIIQILSGKAGIYGMVTGQVADIIEINKMSEGEALQFIHAHKTGALITAAIQIGAILVKVSDHTFENLTAFGNEIGKCFQIQDDILDVTGTKEELGKTPGTDAKNQTLTYPRVFGLEHSKKLAQESYSLAIEHLNQTDLNTDMLTNMANFILNRRF